MRPSVLVPHYEWLVAARQFCQRDGHTVRAPLQIFGDIAYRKMTTADQVSVWACEKVEGKKFAVIGVGPDFFIRPKLRKYLAVRHGGDDE